LQPLPPGFDEPARGGRIVSDMQLLLCNYVSGDFPIVSAKTDDF
jgi:hypothetical protein